MQPNQDQNLQSPLNIAIVLGYNIKNDKIILNNNEKIDFKASNLNFIIKSRVEALFQHLKQIDERIIIIFSGNGGGDLTEARVMYEYFEFLISQSKLDNNKNFDDQSKNLENQNNSQEFKTPKDKILGIFLEEESHNTFQNAKNCKSILQKIINGKNELTHQRILFFKKYSMSNLQITLVTSFYHCRRSYIYFSYFQSELEEQLGIKINFKFQTAPNDSDKDEGYMENVLHNRIIGEVTDNDFHLIEKTHTRIFQDKKDKNSNNTKRSLKTEDLGREIHLELMHRFEIFLKN